MQHELSDLAELIGATLLGPDATIDGASIDSRTVTTGQLFVPIVAERDGHDFIESAVAAGAVAHLTARPDRAVGSALLVDDTAAALSSLGRRSRQRLDDREPSASVIGVTGSVGKTSVKDLIHASVGADRLTHANPASFNNELGLPLTLLNTPDDAAAVVLEMGARGAGHIAELCEIGRPTVGVVTRVAHAHTELFGSIEGVAQAKGELVEALPADGVAVLNADDERVAAMAARTAARVLTFGARAGDVRVDRLTLDASLVPSFVLHTPAGERPVTLTARGAHMATNAAAAVATALAVGVDLDVAVAGVEAASVSALRMDVRSGPTGATLINDSYNANPTSMRAALAALEALPVRRRTAVVGVMAELGDVGDGEHRAIAAEASAADVRLIAVAAPAYGESADHVEGIDEALELLGALDGDDGVLIKGSRVARLERLIAHLAPTAAS